MNKSIKVLALVLALVMMMSVVAGCGKKKNKDTESVSSQTVLMQKPEAQNVINALKGDKEVQVVQENNGTNKNVFSDTEEEKFWISENAASGGLDSVTYKITYTEANRAEKLNEFYAKIKQIMMSVDSAMTAERADALVATLKSADGGYGVESVKSIENENGFNYVIHFLSTPQVDFIVGVNTYK